MPKQYTGMRCQMLSVKVRVDWKQQWDGFLLLLWFPASTHCPVSGKLHRETYHLQISRSFRVLSQETGAVAKCSHRGCIGKTRRSGTERKRDPDHDRINVLGEEWKGGESVVDNVSELIWLGSDFESSFDRDLGQWNVFNPGSTQRSEADRFSFKKRTTVR